MPPLCCGRLSGLLGLRVLLCCLNRRLRLPQRLGGDVVEREGLEPGGYFLLSAHREENIDTEANFTSLFGAINALAEEYGKSILYSCHPRSHKRLEASGFQAHPLVRTHETMGFHDYNKLQSSAYRVVSDSGALPEESSFFASVGRPLPAVCIRTSTERPEALDKGCFVLAGIDERGLLNAVRTAVALTEDGLHGIPVPDYQDDVAPRSSVSSSPTPASLTAWCGGNTNVSFYDGFAVGR